MNLNGYYEWDEWDAEGWADGLMDDTEFIVSLEGCNDEEIKDLVKDKLQDEIQYDGNDADWDEFLDTVAYYFLKKFYSPIV